nr:MAG TPA: hypothetical protein [Siphoviridae sp. cthBp9]
MQIRYTFTLSIRPPWAMNRQHLCEMNNELTLIYCLQLSSSSIRPP